MQNRRKLVKFIYNSNSGDKSIVNKIDMIIHKYQEKGYMIAPFRIDKGINIESAFYDTDENYDHILIAGGDGTLNRVINYMKKENIKIPIAILPTGTANDFAKMIGMEDDIEKTLNIILNSRPNEIDLGNINGEYFINICSAGMFTDISYNINNNMKNSLGRVAYYIKGIESALNMKKFNIKLNSNEFSYEGDIYLILIFNGNTAGNIKLAHESKLNDGLLDVVIFKAMPIPKTIPILLDVLKGNEFTQYKDIIYFKSSEIYIESEEEIFTDIDGEKGPNLPCKVKCNKSNVNVVSDYILS